MKKYIFVALFLALLATAPVLAQTITLEQIIQALQANPTLLAQVQEAIKKISVQPQPQSGCYEFKRNFRETEDSDDADEVKDILKEEDVPDIKEFQEKYSDEILKPLGLKEGTGYIGISTRKKLNELSSARCKPFITPTELGVVQVGQKFNRQLTFHSSNSGPQDWKIISGQLPNGLSLEYLYGNNCKSSSTMGCTLEVYVIGAFISGTPTVAGTYTFTIQATNGTQTAQRTYTLTVKGAYDVGVPVISDVSGPATLNVGQQGTWTIKASDPNNKTLSYRVEWGDEPVIAYAAGVTVPPTEVKYQQTATFTHTYSRAGTFRPTFFVSSAGGVSQSSLSVKVGNVNTDLQINSITSPVKVGGTVTIYGAGFTSASQILIDGVWYHTNIISRSNSSLSFIVPNSFGSPCGYAFDPYYCNDLIRTDGDPSSVGAHKISVANSNSQISNSVSLTIIANQPQITVTSPNGGEVWPVGTYQTISWKNSLPNVPLSISLITQSASYACQKAGGNVCPTDISSYYPIATNIKAETSSYLWKVSEIAGKILPDGVHRFWVQVCQFPTSDGKAYCDDSDNLISIVNRSITVTSPNGGEQWIAGSVRPIKWQVSNPTASTKVDLYLVRYSPPCLPNQACLTYAPAPIVLDKNIAWSSAYNWIVATDVDNNPISSGDYQVMICLAGDYAACDRSDKPFTIISATTTQ